ncbi:MAG: DUF58 domain-containing protein, partial [Desulfomonile tiedjei]|nr:DUF58 domain-containing protein [Desulfomonile tiedjei]
KTGKIKMRPTRYGWILVFLLVWLPLSAVGTANNFLVILFTLGIGLSIVSSRMGKRNIRHLDLARRFPDDIFAETPFPLEYLLKADSQSKPAMSLSFKEEDPMEGSAEGVSFPEVNPGGDDSFRGFFTISSRGDKQIRPGTLRSSFPFGLAVYSIECGREDSVLVYPKIEPVSHDLPAWLGSAGRGLERTNPFGTVPYYFRDYVAGDPFKYIEWKKSARTGSLVSKILAEEEAMEIVIRLPNNASEKTLSRASSLVAHFARTRTPICLQGPGLNCGPAKGKEFARKLLTILARWDSKSIEESIPGHSSGVLVEVDESGEFTWSRPGEANAGRSSSR